MIFKKTSCNISLFHYLGLGLGIVLGLGLGSYSNHPLARNRYKSLQTTTRVASSFYLYVLRKYYHTHKDGVVLENTYSLQVLHTSKDGVVLGTPIQDSQRVITLREYIMRFPL